MVTALVEIGGLMRTCTHIGLALLLWACPWTALAQAAPEAPAIADAEDTTDEADEREGDEAASPPEAVAVEAPSTPHLDGELGRSVPALVPAVLAFDQGRSAQARELFEAWLANQADSPATGGARFLLGRTLQRLGEASAARQQLDRAIALLPELAPIVIAERARIAARDGRVAEAVSLLARLPSSHRGFSSIAFDVLERALRTGTAGEVEAILPKVAQATTTGPERARLARIEADLAFALTQDRTALLERQAHIWRHWPSSETARQAEPALLAATQDTAGTPRAPLTLDDLVGALRKRAGQGSAALDPLRAAARARYPQSLTGLDVLIDAQNQLDGRPADTLTRVEAALTTATAPEIRDRLQDQRARAMRKLERFDDALEVYRALGREAAAPDRQSHALLEAGRMARRMGRVTEARWFFDRLLARHHEPGPQRAEALFALGWIAWREGQLEEADTYFSRVETADPKASDSSNRTYAERATYWRARVHHRRGRLEAARTAWQDIERRWPLSYYATMSSNWLRVTDATGGAGGVAPSRLAAPSPPLVADVRDVEPSGRAGLTLVRLGLREEARVHLRHLFDRKALDKGGVLLLSALYREAGNESLAHWVVQGGDPLDVPPEKDAWARWLAAFPRPFAEIVNREATASGVDPLLIWSVMRQESGFRTEARSHAKAHGLMQVLLPTARLVATRLLKERAPTLRNVYKADKNVRYGAAYLRHLLDRFNGHPALAIAGYNAGPGAVDKWLKRFGALDADEFVEEIPYDEARGYTRKVLRSYAAYRRLYGEPGRSQLFVPLELPRKGTPLASN